MHTSMVLSFVAEMESHEGSFHVFSAILLIILKSLLLADFSTPPDISFQDSSCKYQVPRPVSMPSVSRQEGCCSKDGNKA